MNRKIYIRLSAIFFFFFSSWAASYTLISIWFGQKLHLTGAEIGFIFSINSIFTLILQPVYGYLLDKLGVRKNVLVFLSIILALTGPFFVYVYGPVLQNNFMLGTLIGGIFIGGSYLASIGAVESYVEKNKS
jgi:LacY proton/sugar symporter.